VELALVNSPRFSENLRFGGSLDEDGADVEAVVESGKAVSMDFFDPDGRRVEPARHVRLGDPLVFRIDVSASNQGTQGRVIGAPAQPNRTDSQ